MSLARPVRRPRGSLRPPARGLPAPCYSRRAAGRRRGHTARNPAIDAQRTADRTPEPAGRGRPRMSARPRHRRLPVAVAIAVLALTGAAIALNGGAAAHPGPFYAPPSRLPAGPRGTIIRSQLMPGVYQGARTYRVLYESTAPDGRAAAVSGLIFVPEGSAPRRGRRIIAFAHGTVGVARSCAPSLRGARSARVVEGLGQFIAAGDVVAASDYSGMGAPGPSAYLWGRLEAMNTIDIVRAAHRLKAAHAGVEYAVWGHSQGGQASLFAAEIAPSYAPELRLVGVAAGAPVPDLAVLVKNDSASAGGRILDAMTLQAWAQARRGPHLIEEVVAPASRQALQEVAARCLYDNAYLQLDPIAEPIRLLRQPPWQREPWRTILEDATPGLKPIAVPVLVIQGGADKVVPPALTQALVSRLCAHGVTAELRLYPGAEHSEAGTVASPDVSAWIAQRFAGAAAPSTCNG